MKKLVYTLLTTFVFFSYLAGGAYLANANILDLHRIQQHTEVQAQPEVAEPVRLLIPKFNMDLRIEAVGEDEQGRMSVPQVVDNAAWWEYGAKPGEVGSAVIAGHVDTPDGRFGPFYVLDRLLPGDTIVVQDKESKQHVYEVVFVQSYPDEEFPIDVVFEKEDKKRLNLITCAGTFDTAAKNYVDRLVVFAEAIE